MTVNLKPVFLYRDKALARAKKRLNALRVGESVAKPVLFYHGPSGVGKSTLLRKIQAISVEQLLPTAILDFEDEDVRETTNIADLPAIIMAQWKSSGRQLPPVKYITGKDTIETATEKLLDYARQLHTGAWPTPVVLLVDTLERAGEAAFTWLQQDFLPTLLEEKKVFVALASRYNPDGLNQALGYAISKDMRVISLAPFSTSQSRDHIEKLQQINNLPENEWLKDILDNPLPFTGGLPYYNEWLVLHPFRNDREARKYLVENVLFKMVATGNLTEVRDEIVCIAAFRHCDNATLAAVVHHFWPEKHRVSSPRAGIRLARAMRATTLVERHPEGYGVVVLPALRRLIDDYARDENLARHLETHILGYCCAKQNINDGDFDAFLNHIYHLGGIWYDWEPALKAQLAIPDERSCFDALTSEGVSKAQLAIPDDIPVPDEREKVLRETVKADLETLQRHTNHTGNQIEKNLSTLEKEYSDFKRFFSPKEMEAIKEALQQALEMALDSAPAGGIDK